MRPSHLCRRPTVTAVDRCIGTAVRERDNIAETDSESGIAWVAPVSLESSQGHHLSKTGCRRVVFSKRVEWESWPKEMKHYLAIAVVFVGGVLANPCEAQTPPAAPPVQNQAGQSILGVPSAVVPGQANAGPTSVPTPGVGSSVSSSTGKTFGSAGRGLPGMPGGPPIKGSMGSQDPSSRYMTPPVIPPLLCDPAVNIPC